MKFSAVTVGSIASAASFACRLIALSRCSPKKDYRRALDPAVEARLRAQVQKRRKQNAEFNNRVSALSVDDPVPRINPVLRAHAVALAQRCIFRARARRIAPNPAERRRIRSETQFANPTRPELYG